MTKETLLNEGWEFQKNPGADFFTGGTSEAERVRLPHTGTELPMNYSDERTYQYVSGYRNRLNLPPLLGGRRLFVTFEGAAQRARIIFNGVTLKTHACGYTACAAELTGRTLTGENLLAVELDSREELDQPPFGNQIDYLTYQGLYRNCRLTLTDPTFLADVFVRTRGTTLIADLTVVGHASGVSLQLGEDRGTKVAAESRKLRELSPSELPFPKDLPVEETECRRYTMRLACPGIAYWSPEKPQLYTLTVSLLNEAGEPVERRELRVGFRDAEFRADGFYLNGERLTLIGLDRHQSFPVVGYAMPDNVQARDAEILREELGLNLVRTSHYPQSEAFLKRCDELGLMVFTEIPGWQHIGGDAWKDQAVRNTEDMIRQARNHPCVILWGVRINESPDDDAFYTRTNRVARALDPSRQTGGVRNFRKSSFLEDVYTYNDFLHDGVRPGLAEKRDVVPDMKIPYLVTEYSGHMFPTKQADDAPHRLEHALRHARILDAMYAAPETAGCVGWCAFDYQTHRDFGSGDRICYHGVMDMFRNPKPAAAVYASQNGRQPVLEVTPYPDPGDWPASITDAIWAFTNADSVRLYRDDRLLREFLPDRVHFPHLPHPPVRITDFSGPEFEEEEGFSPEIAEQMRTLWAADPADRPKLRRQLRLRRDFPDEARTEELRQRYAMPNGRRTYRFEAVRGGKVIAVRRFEPLSPAGIELRADRTVLRCGNAWEAAAVRIRACDRCGNPLPYFEDPVLLETEGEVEIIGPELLTLRGGSGGVWVRPKAGPGSGTLKVTCRGNTQRIAFTVTR